MSTVSLELSGNAGSHPPIFLSHPRTVWPSAPGCLENPRVCSGQHRALILVCYEMFIPLEPNTQDHIPKFFNSSMAGITVIESLKKSHRSLKKKHALQKEPLLKCESLCKPKSPVRSILYFNQTIGPCAGDNAGYSGREAWSPWQWQWQWQCFLLLYSAAPHSSSVWRSQGPTSPRTLAPEQLP